jgi:hypothetical protein
MANYAISDGSRIINVIVAESQEIAEQATGMTAIETSGEPWIDWTLEVEGWRIPSPFPSWTWIGTEWQPPVPMPTLGGYTYMWNEELLNWDQEEIPQPFPSWIRDENNNWVAPVPMPEGENNYDWDETSQNWVVVGE